MKMLIVQPIGYAARKLFRDYKFTMIVLLVLSVGIGLNTSVFAILDQVLLRPLSVRSPSTLTIFRHSGPDEGFVRAQGDDPGLYFSYPSYRELRNDHSVFDGIIARCPVSLAANWTAESEILSGELVSGNFFDVLRIHAALGRLFVPSDDVTAGSSSWAVLSYSYWENRFGKSPEVLNRVIHLNGNSFTIIGVAEKSFQSIVVGQSPDIYLPVTMAGAVAPAWGNLENRASRWLNILGRLPDGVSKPSAESKINVAWHGLRARDLLEIKGVDSRFSTEFMASHIYLDDGAKGLSPVRRTLAKPLWILFYMGVLVLFTTCANVAMLLLTRAAQRRQETALKFALGARRQEILRDLVIEVTALALLASLLSILISWWSTSAVLKIVPANFGISGLQSTPDGRILAFSLFITFLTTLGFCVVPALRMSRPQLSSALKDSTKSVTGHRSRTQKILVAAQMGLSLLLMTAAALLGRTLSNLKNEHLGFYKDNIFSLTINPAQNGYTAPRQLSEQLVAALAAQSGVRSVSLSTIKLLNFDRASSNISVAGFRPSLPEDSRVFLDRVGPEFFSTLGISLKAGREFKESDTGQSRKVGIVNESFARFFFGAGQNPIGRFVGLGDDSPNVEIVGVVGDSKYSSVRETPTKLLYLPVSQQDELADVTIYVRTMSSITPVIETAHRTVASVAPGLPIKALEQMDTRVDKNLWMERLIAVVALSFCGVATLLAALGLYAVVAFNVASKTREIAIRMALGALKAQVVRGILRDVVIPTAIGLAVALPLSLVLSHLMRGLLFEVSDRDPWIITEVVLTLFIIILVSAWIPARRATRVDPMTSLRAE